MTNRKAQLLRITLNGDNHFLVGYHLQKSFYSSDRAHRGVQLEQYSLTVQQCIDKEGTSRFEWRGNTNAKVIQWLKAHINCLPPTG